MNISDERKRLIFSVLRLMGDDCKRCSSELRESLEVAMQCIGEVYGVDELQGHLGVSFNLQDVFNVAAAKDQGVTEAQKAEAATLKEKGNEFLRQGDFDQAVEMYTQAIAIDRTNAIFYANRAAAYMKLQQHQRVVDDCQAAIRIDPSYSKAHYRLGNAFVSLGNKVDAVSAFEKAVELDSSNVTYKESLSAIQAELSGEGGAAPGRPAAAAAGGMPNLGGMDFSAMMSNPNFMNMAANLVNTPGFANMAASMMSGGGQGGGGFMQTAQQIAEQMQETNPGLLEQVRQMGNDAGGAGSGSGQSGDGGAGSDTL